MPDLIISDRLDPLDNAPAAADSIGPAQGLKALRRNWRLLLVCALTFGVFGYVGAKVLLPQQFTASGAVAVDNRSVAVPALEGALKSPVLADPMPVVRSEVAILQSPALIRSVVRDLKLQNDPNFNTTLRPPPLLTRLKLDVARMLPTALSRAAADSGVLPDIRQSAPPPPQVVDDIVVGNVQRRLSVYNYGQSLVITVQFRAPSGQTAAAVVNDLIRRYMAEKQAVLDQANTAANATLSQRLQSVRARVDALEQKIQQTRQTYEIVQTRAGTVGQQQLQELSAALTRASTDRAALQADYARASSLAQLGGGTPDGVQGLNAGTIAVMREQEANAARRVAELSQTYGPRYPALRAAEARLAAARAAVSAETHRAVTGLHAQVEAAQQREDGLRQQLAAAQAKASRLATVQAKLQQYQKDADAERTLYQSLLISADQTQSGGHGVSGVDARVVSLATPPAFPSSPRPKFAGALGLVSGLAFGGFLTLLRRRTHDVVLDPEDLAAETGGRPVTVIPRQSLRGAIGSLAGLVAEQPSGAVAEALRLLRTQLRAVGRGAMPRTLLFVSISGGEGSSSVAAAFARLAALDGLRTLLIEGDLETPSLAVLLDAPPSNGLADALAGRDHWMEVIRRDPLSMLDCLLVSGSEAGAARLLQTTHLPNLLAEAKEEYNLVVLDVAPVGVSTNAFSLATGVDAIVLVLAAGATTPADLHDALGAIARAGARPLVLVLNKA
ncbi:MAG TPA: polysaccharide biosynthesis tyrosine autokinase [Acetobacteraceae bacterium]|nr:polysaccharide biosynthesis tyrosine autokinase [Acetobacteraceae bacterium]